MKALYMTLAMDLSGPEGPGWYAYAGSREENEPPQTLIPPVRLAPQGAEIVAQGFQRITQQTLSTQAVTPLQLVHSGNQLMRNAIKARLEAAEEAARQVKGLRQSLQALEQASATVEEQPERQE